MPCNKQNVSVQYIFQWNSNELANFIFYEYIFTGIKHTDYLLCGCVDASKRNTLNASVQMNLYCIVISDDLRSIVQHFNFQFDSVPIGNIYL